MSPVGGRAKFELGVKTMDKSLLKSFLWTCIDEQKDDLLRLCSDLIRIPSENPPGNVDQVIAFISKYLSNSQIGISLVAEDAHYPNIVASIGQGPGLIFNGHCDVVPVGDLQNWNFDPFGGEITASTIRGRGASDMKCGLGAALFAMRLCRKQSIPLKKSVKLHIVSDEETGGVHGTKWLVEQGFAQGGIACIVAEPTGRDNCEVGQKGQLRVHLMARGKAAHGSIGNYVGENAILKMMTVIRELDKLRSMKGRYSETQLPVLADSKRIAEGKLKTPGVGNVIDHVTINVGIIQGGIKINVVPDLCETDVDIRLPIGLSSNEVVSKLDQVLKESGIQGVSYTFEASEANYTEVSEPLVRTIQDNAESVWRQPVTPSYQWASSDAKYYRLQNIPTLQYGPANTAGIHSYDEDVDILDVVNATKVYIGAICDLLV